jgi:hypothetical protein
VYQPRINLNRIADFQDESAILSTLIDLLGLDVWKDVMVGSHADIMTGPKQERIISYNYVCGKLIFCLSNTTNV